jgi:hypothetical protein
MSKSLIALTLAVQVATVAVFSAFSSEDSQAAYPMEAGYLVKDQNLQVVYYDGTPAELTYEKMEAPIRRSRTHSGLPSYIKRVKNLKCERRDQEGQSSYRCALDMKRIPRSGI